MTELKKVELTEENLDEVAGGNKKNVKKTIAVAAGIVAAIIAGYQTYHKTSKLLDSSDGTSKDSKKGGGLGEGGTVYHNDNRGGKQMNVQMGKNINSSSGNKM